jgi:hypothetical protein
VTPERMKEIVSRREQMLLAIEVWGPGVVYERGKLFREIAKWDQYGLRAVKWALIEQGMPTWEVEDLMLKGHPRGCACWHCVLWLNRACRRAQSKLTKAATT